MIRDPLQYYSTSGYVDVSLVEISDMPFTQAFRATTEDQSMDPWNAQLHLQVTEDMAESDVMFVSFYARSIYSAIETGEAFVNPILENNSTYEKTLSQLVGCSPEWKLYQIPFTSTLSLSSSQSHFSFFLGYTNQIVEIADIQLLNYYDSITIDELPETEFSYFGREDTASWRAEATERIETYRKGDLTIHVEDEYENEVDSARIEIRMLQHQFRFGSAIAGQEFLSNTVYREKIYEIFNEVVFENDLKWPMWHGRSDHSYILQALDSLDKYNLTARGHVLVWPSWRHTPSYLESLEDDPYNLDIEILEHIEEVAGYTQGRLIDWDVINEPYDNHDLMDILGKEDMGIWFVKARETDSVPDLYLNDYGILSSSGLNGGHQDHFYQTVKYIERYGGHVDGFGFQSHFGYGLTSIPKVFTLLDRYASMGKKIKITEFDVEVEDSQLQADYMRDFVTICYSHPAVKGILNWGFWAGRHYDPDIALYDLDWNIRPHGEVWMDLIYDQWWTHDTLMTDTLGTASLSGFLGDYEINVSKEGVTLVDTIELSSFNGAELWVQLMSGGEMEIINEAIPDTIIYFEPYEWDVEVPEIEPYIPEEIIPEAVDTKLQERVIELYPNPCSDFLIVRNAGHMDAAEFRILDLSGRILMADYLPDQQVIRGLSGLNAGMYSLQLITKEENIIRHFIKR